MEITLQEAHRRIFSALSPLPAQSVALSEALSRCPVEEIHLIHPKPAFDQSTRDGFVVADPQGGTNDALSAPAASYTIIGEIAAGSPRPGPLTHNTTYRIMTGAQVPEGAGRVIPFELVDERDGRIFTAGSPGREPSHIRKKGCQFPPGAVIAPRGVPLSVESLTVLCEDGVKHVRVSRPPTVHVLCTGTELVSPGQLPGRGEKVSSNGILLSALLGQTGAFCSMGDPVADDPEALARALREARESAPDMIITTGGMGPGKYDFLERAFVSLGGEVLYNRLSMRPGKATLFGLIGNTAVFALPGPPPAVRLLYHILVSPALKVLSGSARPEPSITTAKLEKDLDVKRTGHLNLKAGRLSFSDGQLLVRPISGMEPMNAILHCAGDRTSYKSGESVSVQLLL